MIKYKKHVDSATSVKGNLYLLNIEPVKFLQIVHLVLIVKIKIFKKIY